MEKSAIILAGGFSSRFGQDKGLLLLANKPLIKHILDAISEVVEEKLLVVSSKFQAESYAKVLGSKVKVLIDDGKVQSPLVGAIKGFKEASNEYALLLPCDTPLISKSIISLLFELCPNKNAVIPRWPNGYIEPLQAVYCTKPALEAAEKAFGEDRLNMQSMVDKLRGVRYISTIVLRQLDPELRSFFNVNTPIDLRRAELLLKNE
ncbi:MAG: molybdenum cofactor guanylyltransferase [Candidatus Bathycorpusculaceae bacterium]